MTEIPENNTETENSGQQTAEVSSAVLAAAQTAEANSPRMTVDEQISASSEDRQKSEAAMAGIRNMLGSPEPEIGSGGKEKQAVPFDSEKLDRFANMNPDELRAFLRETDDKIVEANQKSVEETVGDGGKADTVDTDEITQTQAVDETSESVVVDSEDSTEEEEVGPDDTEQSNESGLGATSSENRQQYSELTERINETAKQVLFIKENLGIDLTDPKNEKLLWVDEEDGKSIIDVLYEIGTQGESKFSTDGSIDGIAHEDIMKIIEDMEGHSDAISDLYEVEAVDEESDEDTEMPELYQGYAEIKELDKVSNKRFKFRFKPQV
jgi:hypothetical protein